MLISGLMQDDYEFLLDGSRVIAQKKAKIRPFFLVKPESAVLTNCLKTLAVCDQILSLRELFEQKDDDPAGWDDALNLRGSYSLAPTVGRADVVSGQLSFSDL